MDFGGQRRDGLMLTFWDQVHCYIGHTLFSGMGSWAKEPHSVGDLSDLGDAVPPTGMRAAIAAISPI